MKEVCKPINTKDIISRPKGFMSWVIDHVRPSVSVLPPHEGMEDDISGHGLEGAWNAIKDRIQIAIRLTFKF
jgi:hypothetical protein